MPRLATWVDYLHARALKVMLVEHAAWLTSPRHEVWGRTSRGLLSRLDDVSARPAIKTFATCNRRAAPPARVHGAQVSPTRRLSPQNFTIRHPPHPPNPGNDVFRSRAHGQFELQIKGAMTISELPGKAPKAKPFPQGRHSLTHSLTQTREQYDGRQGLAISQDLQHHHLVPKLQTVRQRRYRVGVQEGRRRQEVAMIGNKD